MYSVVAVHAAYLQWPFRPRSGLPLHFIWVANFGRSQIVATARVDADRLTQPMQRPFRTQGENPAIPVFIDSPGN